MALGIVGSEGEMELGGAGRYQRALVKRRAVVLDTVDPYSRRFIIYQYRHLCFGPNRRTTAVVGLHAQDMSGI
jgi:hypothetical protein